MKRPVMLSLRGRQSYRGQEPDVIELMSEGTMEYRDGIWEITYEESELTGLEGVTTTFQIEPGKVILDRKGNLSSRMVFEEGTVHESLYQVPYGAVLVTVEATQVSFELSDQGGYIDIAYNISIENMESGVIDYHLDIRGK